MICQTHDYRLIRNCLFLRIMPNGCTVKPPSNWSQDYGAFESYSVPSNWCNFDLRKEIEGFVATYINDRNTAVYFFWSNHQCTVSCNPMYLHPPALCTASGRSSRRLTLQG